MLWRELDRETQAFGLATTGGTVSNTGIAGLTLGGGLGWLMGKHGLTVDNLRSADVITADGTFRTVSVDADPDLFWALRGGGGNFGVVVSFDYDVHPVDMVLGGMVVYGLDQARDVLRFYREFCPTLPDEAEAYLGVLTDPNAGIPVIAMVLGYNGDLAEGERVLAPARAFGSPLIDLVGPVPYGARQVMLDEPNAINGLHRYWRSAFVEVISDDFIDAIIEQAVGVQLTAERLALLLHARGGDASAGRGHGVLCPAGHVGLRRHRAMGRADRVRRPHLVGAHRLGCVRSPPRRRRRLHQPPLRRRAARSRCAPPTAPTWCACVS